MDKDALKKSVTLNLRCVAQSSKGGVPLSSLQNDYKALIGTAIPFIELGHNSLEGFLKSVPDVVCLKKNKGGQCIVEGVADASTAHIASLISRQKTTKGTKKTNSKKPSLPIRKYSHHESWRSPTTNSEGNCKQNNKTCNLIPANSKVPMPKPVNLGTISSTSRKVVSANGNNNVIYGQSTTKAHPLDAGPSNSGMLYSSLFTDINTFIRPPVPPSISQKQTEVLEKAISPISEISNTSKEIVQLSNVPEEPTLSRSQRKKKRKPAMKEILSNASESPLTKSQRKSRKKKIKKAEKLHEMTNILLEIKKADKLQERTERFFELIKEDGAPTTLQKAKQSEESCKGPYLPPSIRKKRLILNLTSVVLRNKGGVLLENLQKDYQMFFGVPILYQELGYDTLQAFIQAIPDAINLKKNKDGQIYAQAVSDSTTDHIEDFVSKQKQSNITKSATQYPLETISSPVTLTSVKIKEPVLPSFFSRKPSDSVLPNQAASNFEWKPSLNYFPNIRYSIASAKFSSLLTMNLLLFGDDSYLETLKRGILAFDGFSFCKGSEQWKEKEILFSMLSEDTLRECFKLLCIECKSGNKKELVNELLEFLASPVNTLSNSVKKKATEKIIKKEGVDSSSVAFGSFDIDEFEKLKQLQEYVHNQEFKTLSEVNVKYASTSNSSNTIESVQACQSVKLNAKPTKVKVAKKKKRKKSAQKSVKQNTSVESEQFQKLQSVFSLNPNLKASDSSAEMPRDAASNGYTYES